MFDIDQLICLKATAHTAQPIKAIRAIVDDSDRDYVSGQRNLSIYMTKTLTLSNMAASASLVSVAVLQYTKVFDQVVKNCIFLPFVL